MRAPDHSRLIAYASVHGGKSLLWAGEDVLSLYIVICVLRMPPAMAGLVFLASSVWNAALDSLWGACIGRAGWARRHLPAIAGGAALISCVTFSALPLLPAGATIAGVAAIVLFRTAFSLCDVPHNGLTTAIAGDYGHLPVARLRAIGSSVAGVVIGLVAIPLLGTGQNTGSGGVWIAFVGFVAGGLMLPLPWLLRQGSATPHSAIASNDAPQSQGVIGFCALSVLGFAAIAAIGRALLHVQPPSAQGIELVPLVLAISRLAAVWMWSPLAAALGTAAALRLAYAACAAVALLLPIAMVGGGLVEYAVLIAFGLAAGGIGLLCWSRLSELSAANGGDDPAVGTLHYAVFTMATKLALGLSGAIVGLWLSASGASHVSPGALWQVAGIAVLGGGFAAAFRQREPIGSADAPALTQPSLADAVSPTV